MIHEQEQQQHQFGGGGSTPTPVGPPVPPSKDQAAQNVSQGKKKQQIGFDQTILSTNSAQTKSLLGD
jgi:hypothetical protein